MKQFFSKIYNFYTTFKMPINLAVLLCFIVAGFFNLAFALVTVIIAIIMLFFDTVENGFAYLMFLSPFGGAIRVLGKPGGFIIVLTGFLIATLIKMIIKKEFKLNWLVIAFAGLFIGYLFLPIGGYTQLKFSQMGRVLLLVFSFYIIIYNTKSINLYKLTILGFVGLSISVLLSLFIDSFVAINSSILVVYSERYAALFSNVNYLSEYCIILLTMIICYIFTNKSTNILLTLSMLIVTTAIGFLTKSKSFMVLVMCIAVLLVVIYFIKCFNNKKMFYFLPLLVGSVVLIIIVAFNILDDRLINSSLDLVGVTTSRSLLWKDIINALTQSSVTLLFGIGTVAEFAVPNIMTVHNIYLEMFLKFGIVGCLILTGLLVVMIVDYFKFNKFKFSLVNFLPLVIISVYGMVESYIMNPCTLFLLPLGYILAVVNTNNDNKDDSDNLITDINIKQKVNNDIKSSLTNTDN